MINDQKSFTLVEHERSKSLRRNESFTLIELLVVSGIILLISAIIFPNYRAGEQEFAIQRSAHKLSQDLRRAEELALSAKAYPGAPASFKGGYGVNFKINSTSYTLFADLNDDKAFNLDSDGVIETPSLESKVKIIGLSSTPLNIVFLSPDPQVFISGGSEAQITISLETNPSKTKIIKVNQAGLIAIQ